MSLCRQIFEHCHFVQNFPPVPEMILKTQSDLLYWATGFFTLKCLWKYAFFPSVSQSQLGYRVFSNGLRKYTIWVYVDKYLNIAICSEFPLGSRNYIENSIRPSPLGYRIFLWKVFENMQFSRQFVSVHRATVFFLQMVLINTQFEFM